jgi:WD repeat-containing protein 92
MPIYTVKAHKQIINCVDGVGGLGIGEGAPEILTASRDGEIHNYFIDYLKILSI